jgi:radical SAM superfamily enzyme YgiQ (UPF0313 family)
MRSRKKILFIQPPHYFESEGRPPSTFPLGLCYVATVTKKAGHVADIFDIWLGQYSYKEVSNKIKKLSDYDAFAITALSTQYKYVKFLTEQLKRYYPNTKIILGNALATHSSEIVLSDTSVDLCVRGEGEVTFMDLLDNDFSNLAEIPGISFKDKENKIQHNLPRQYIKNIDDIPFPDHELFDIKGYLKNIRVWGRPDVKAMNVVCGRGCPYSCSFCSKTFNITRLRSVENIIEEIISIKEKYHIGGIFFLDELVVVNRERTINICRFLRNLKLDWNCQARVDTVDFSLLKIMKKSGCISVGFGIESGSQKIINSMNKRIKVSQSIRAVKAALKLNMDPNLQMMYGFPGENEETLKETEDFFKKIEYHLIHPLSITTPIPGSILYDNCIRKGIINDEINYLVALEQGYHKREYPLLNLTEFSDKEYMQKKRQTEENIDHNYHQFLRNNLIKRLLIYLHSYTKRLIIYYNINGILNTIYKIVQKASAAVNH